MQLKTYTPIPRFPPLSLSGTACQLSCQHCNRAYLRGMQPVTTPETLVRACRELRAQGAIGALLSGGSTQEGGILNLPEMVEAIRVAKRETGLILNIHPGLMDEATAAALANPIDFVSLEIPATETIREVFGLDATTADYVATYQRLRAAGMHVVPHISVYDGGEDQLLEAIVDLPHPETIVVIVFSPTRGTPMAEAAAPSPDVVGGVVARLVAAFPKTEITLGCMRPRTKAIRGALELAALDAGVSRMELPSRETLAVAKARGYEIVRFDACCALPRALEARARHLAHA